MSPADKSGGSINDTGQPAGLMALSRTGDRATFMSYAAFGGAANGMPAQYVAQRTEGGWTTKLASPAPGKANPNTFVGDSATWSFATPDLTFGIASTTDQLDPTDAAEGSRDIYGFGVGTSAELVSRGTGGQRSTGFNVAAYAGMTDDGSSIYFTSPDDLAPPAAEGVSGTNVYVRSGGSTTLVNQTSGGQLIGHCGAIVGDSSEFGGSRRNATAPGNGQVIFETPDPMAAGDLDCSKPRQLYVRAPDGEVTEISASQRATPDPAGPRDAIFQGASSDGKRVIFTSDEKLSDDAGDGRHIYQYDVPTGELHALVSERGRCSRSQTMRASSTTSRNRMSI